MSVRKPLAIACNDVFLYDGSLKGFYCCVHESVYGRCLPTDIVEEGSAQPSMFRQRLVEADEEKAARVRESIVCKISPRARELTETVFLSCMERREIALLRFLLKCYEQGPRVLAMLGDALVSPLIKAERHLLGEAHLLKGFVRFSDYGGVLVATITPKNFVLPYLVQHFTGRYSEEKFLIYDKTHGVALTYSGGKTRMVELDSVEFPEVDEKEEKYRELWKRFYKTVAIEGRHNPRCRMTHMPKRYWENMLEVEDELVR